MGREHDIATFIVAENALLADTYATATAACIDGPESVVHNCTQQNIAAAYMEDGTNLSMNPAFKALYTPA